MYLHVGTFNPLAAFFAGTPTAFGIGDVYFIAGQSNAAGYNKSDKSLWENSTNIAERRGFFDYTGTNDETVPFLPNTPPNNTATSSVEFSRILTFNGRFDYWASIYNNPNLGGQALIDYNILSRNYNELSPVNGNYFGLPHGGKYSRLSHGTDKVNDPVYIYPNGEASWYWTSLGHKITKEKGVPTLFFNTAVSSTSLIKDWTTATYTPGVYPPYQEKFLNTLSLYGAAHGAKAVLWHQGEDDSFRSSSYYTGSDVVNVNDYGNRLSGLINNSRSVLGDATSKNMAWYVAKTSLFSWNSNALINATGGFGLSGATEFTLPGTSSGGNTHYYTNSILKNQQSSLLIPSTNNIFEGAQDSDNIVNNSRDNKNKLHFSGDKVFGTKNTLIEMADRWYTAIYNQYGNYNGLAPSDLVKISSISQNGNNITITYENVGTEYYFVKGQNGVFNGSISGISNPIKTYNLNGQSTSSNSYTFNVSNLNNGEFLSCYVKIGNKLVAGQPYKATPIGLAPNSKVLDVFNSNMNIGSNSQKISNNVFAKNVIWQISSKPTWVSNITTATSNNDQNIEIDFSQNTGALRSGLIVLQEVGGGLSKSININQSAAIGITTPLTNLTPTTASGYYQFNKSINNNTMKVNNVLYTNGFGVQATNNLYFNLNGSYTTFTGKVGQDDESVCGDGMIFRVYGDGVLLTETISSTTGITKLNGQSAQAFSYNVSGKNTLRLETNEIGNTYCDHGDWIDPTLSTGSGGCGTPPIAPTNVASSNYNPASGAPITLTATCAIGSVAWNVGTGSPLTQNPTVTTNYQARCVSPGCADSPVVGINVTVGTGPCSAVSNSLAMGTWTVTNHPLVARFFNNQYWLTQRIGTNPEKFLVRGANMLTRPDVTLANGTYSSLGSCFAWNNAAYGGLAVPSSTTFATPAGFTLAYEPDGTPFYTAGACANPPLIPSNPIANPANITAGASSTLSATCSVGQLLWSTGSSLNSISVSPSSTTTYTVKCISAGCPDSPSASITVTVGPCSSVTHNLVMGTWTVTGHPLVAKFYNGQYWLVQRIATNPEKFLVRGSSMLTRPDVTLANSTNSILVGCFAWTYSNYGGLATPSTTQFVTPPGWTLSFEPDGTPFYTNAGGARKGVDSEILKEDTPKFISVYPNPNQGSFNVKVYLERDSELSIDLISSIGKIYQSQKANGKAGENIIPFVTNKISGGTYFMRVLTKDKVETTIVVID
jgi:NPCBM/NEW2 domain/Secretion system C-terminal sorting domain